MQIYEDNDENNGTPNSQPEAQEKNESQNIIDAARAEAKKIKDTAKAEAEAEAQRVKREAEGEIARLREAAIEEGYSEGITKAAAEGEAIRNEARKVLNDANLERDRMRRAIEPEIVNLIIRIVNKLLNDITEINPGAVICLIRQGFAGTTLTGKITVRVSADDFDEVAENKEQLQSVAGAAAEIEIVRDLSLNAMDCVIETPFGNIDCSLSKQYKLLTENLIYILEQTQ